MCRQRRLPGCVSCPAAVAARTDVIDAAAAAAVAVLQGDATPVLTEDASTVLALLDERRDNVITQRTRLVNQLHALLRDLLPGGARTDLTAAAAAQLLARVRQGRAGRDRPQATRPRPCKARSAKLISGSRH